MEKKYSRSRQQYIQPDCYQYRKIALKKIAKRKGQTQIEFEELEKQEKLLSNARLIKFPACRDLAFFLTRHITLTAIN